VPAVDGQSLSQDDIDSVYVQRSADVPLTKGEVGCFLSHRACFERIAADTDPYAVILEDDIHLSRDFAGIVAGSGWIPAGADLVKLETSYKYGSLVEIDRYGVPVGDGRRCHRLHGWVSGTSAYAVSRDAASKLLGMTAKFDRPIDVLMYDPLIGFAGHFNIQQVVPAPCIQDAGSNWPATPGIESIIASEREALAGDREAAIKRRRSLAGKIWRELQRPFDGLSISPHIRIREFFRLVVDKRRKIIIEFRR
jgi:glycosyl transferase family 25